MRKRIFCVILSVLVLCGTSAVAFAREPGPFPESAFYTQGAYTLHYRQFPAEGAPKGRILLIHGFIASTVFWEPLADQFNAAGYDCVLVDLPGFGHSTREAKDLAPIDREDLLAGLMESLAPGASWIVAGHSMGGGVALNLAAQQPEAVEALLLYAPAAFAPVESALFSGLLNSCAGDVLASLMDLMFRALLPVCEWEPLARLIVRSQGYADDYDIRRYSEPLTQPHTGGSLLYMMQRARGLDAEGVAALEMPILLLWAENDMILSKSMVGEIEDCLPAQTEVLTIEDASHVFPEAEARQTAVLSLAFLD